MLDALGEVKIQKHWVPVDGHQMHCLQAGSGPDLILLHGLLGTASSWGACLPGLTTTSTVYAVDALGIGESERVPGIDPTLEAQADRLVRFMDLLHLQQADFLATSHGGAVALMLAVRHPGRIRNLVLAAPANPWSTITDPLIQFYLSSLGTWFAQRVPMLPEQLQSLALGRMYGDPNHLRPGSLEEYMTSLRVPGTVDYVLSILHHWFSDMEKLRLGLSSVIHIPTLLIWGDRDRAVWPESAQDLRRCFEHAELVELPAIGHVPHDECPEVLARVVTSFLVRQRSQTTPGPRLLR
jgi:pimeloyl-ACP methyl ester carboxylesterase